jgi:hypothetical protein
MRQIGFDFHKEIEEEIASHAAIAAAHHAKSTFYELYSTDYQPSTDLTWEDWDLSAIIPMGTIAVLVLCIQIGTGNENVGIRNNGSNLNRRRYIAPRAPLLATTPVGADRIIECYGSVALDAVFQVWGYWI